MENKNEIRVRGINASAKYELIRLAEQKNKSLNQFLKEHLEGLVYTEEMILREEKFNLALKQVADALNRNTQIINEYNENISSLISIIINNQMEE